MGKRLNALLGRSSKASKLEKLANLAVSRITILTNLHRVRCSQARSDVIQLLRLGHQQRALLRVEQVIKEENALDALVMVENYCHLLAEKSELITNSREWECPADLKEGASTLIFAASRTGEFPELHEIRRVLTSKYGKDFAYSAVELRNECSVYPKMVQRLSTERASMESKQNLVMQIGKENGMSLKLLRAVHISRNINLEMHEENDGDDESREQLSESVRAREAYRDAAAADEDAFESAAYAAVQLSRNGSWDESHHQYSETQMRDSEEGESLSLGFTFDDSGSDDEAIIENEITTDLIPQDTIIFDFGPNILISIPHIILLTWLSSIIVFLVHKWIRVLWDQICN